MVGQELICECACANFCACAPNLDFWLGPVYLNLDSDFERSGGISLEDPYRRYLFGRHRQTTQIEGWKSSFRKPREMAVDDNKNGKGKEIGRDAYSVLYKHCIMQLR